MASFLLTLHHPVRVAFASGHPSLEKTEVRMQQAVNQELFTLREAQTYLRVGETQLRRLVGSGDLSVVRIGVRGVRIRRTELERFAREGVRA